MASCDAGGCRDDYITIRIQVYHGNRRPVAGVATPAVGSPSLRASVDALARVQAGDIAAGMSVGRGDEANRTVQVLGVVPGDEGGDPRAGRRHVGKGLPGIRRHVLECAKEGLRERIVVTDARPTEGGEHAEALQRAEHGGAFHRAAVVRVQDDARGRHVLCGAGGDEEGRRRVTRLLGVHGPADDLAAPDVEHEVEIDIDPAHRSAEVGDIPTPHLVRPGRHVRARWPPHRRLGPATMLQQARLPQQAIAGRLRGAMDLCLHT
jgi:hypothetical protein